MWQGPRYGRLESWLLSLYQSKTVTCDPRKAVHVLRNPINSKWSSWKCSEGWCMWLLFQETSNKGRRTPVEPDHVKVEMKMMMCLLVENPNWPRTTSSDRGPKGKVPAGGNSRAPTLLIHTPQFSVHHYLPDTEPRSKSQKNTSVPSKLLFQVASGEAPGVHLKLGGGEGGAGWVHRPLS